MYFEEDFMKDDYVKAIETKRKEHLERVIEIYGSLSKEEISSTQDKLMLRFRLPRKEVNNHVYKLPEVKRESNKKGLSATVMNTN